MGRFDPPSESLLGLLHYVEDKNGYIRSYPRTTTDAARILWWHIKRLRGLDEDWPVALLEGKAGGVLLLSGEDVAGVSSIRADAAAPITGAVVLASGTGITLSEAGQTITVTVATAYDIYRLFPGDKPPTSPSAFDDEFDGTSLDPKWSWVNQGGATFAESDGNGRITAPTGTENWRMLVQTCPAGDFTATFKFNYASKINVDVGRFGFILRNSANSRFEMLGMAAGSASSFQQLRYQRWTNETTFSSDVGSIANPQGGMPWEYVRVTVAGNIITADWSWDGWTWARYLDSSNITTFLGANRAALNQFGFGVSNNGTGLNAQLTAHFFRVT